MVDSVIKNSEIKTEGNKKFIIGSSRFINIDDLHIDLIDRINPFQQAFEILSKSVTTSVLRLIQEAIEVNRIQMSAEEALILWPKIKSFVKNNNGIQPNINSIDPLERRLAEAIIYIQNQRRKQGI